MSPKFGSYSIELIDVLIAVLFGYAVYIVYKKINKGSSTLEFVKIVKEDIPMRDYTKEELDADKSPIILFVDQIFDVTGRQGTIEKMLEDMAKHPESQGDWKDYIHKNCRLIGRIVEKEEDKRNYGGKLAEILK